MTVGPSVAVVVRAEAALEEKLVTAVAPVAARVEFSEALVAIIVRLVVTAAEVVASLERAVVVVVVVVKKEESTKDSKKRIHHLVVHHQKVAAHQMRAPHPTASKRHVSTTGSCLH